MFTKETILRATEIFVKAHDLPHVFASVEEQLGGGWAIEISETVFDDLEGLTLKCPVNSVQEGDKFFDTLIPQIREKGIKVISPDDFQGCRACQLVCGGIFATCPEHGGIAV